MTVIPKLDKLLKLCLKKINFKSLKIDCQVIFSKKTIHKQVEFFLGTKGYLHIRDILMKFITFLIKKK